MYFPNKFFLGLTVIIAITTSFGIWQWLALESGKGVIVEDTIKITRGKIEEVVFTSGTLSPIRKVNIGAQVNGQIKSLHVKVGDRVKKDQLLAEIDPKLQQNELLAAEASLKRIESEIRAQSAVLRNNTLKFEREKELRVADANSKSDLETAQTEMEVSQANIDVLQAQLSEALITVETARTNLSYTRIIAPMDGEVISIISQQGQTVVSQQSAPTILVLADLDHMKVEVKISEADVTRIKLGQKAWFTILAMPKRKFYSKIISVAPSPPSSPNGQESRNKAVYYNGFLEIENKDRLLRSSMTAQVSILLGASDNALLVPVSALISSEQDGVDKVKVASPTGAELRNVTLGLRNYAWAEITSGLEEGERVILPRRPASP